MKIVCGFLVTSVESYPMGYMGFVFEWYTVDTLFKHYRSIRVFKHTSTQREICSSGLPKKMDFIDNNNYVNI